jgi:hypothetical protein
MPKGSNGLITHLNMKNDLVLQLKKLLHPKGSVYDYATDIDISKFEIQRNLVLPYDLKQYFKIVNGSAGKYDDSFFYFNPSVTLKA